MAVGARDAIDKKLVNMYANVKTTNLDTSSRIDPELIWQSMSIIALNNRAYFEVRRNTAGTRKSNLG